MADECWFKALAWNTAIWSCECTLDTHESAVLATLVRHANQDNGNAYPAVETIAKETRACERKVISSIKYLAEMGIVRREKISSEEKKYANNQYWLDARPPVAALNAPRTKRQAGAPGALGLVHDVHQAGAPGALGLVHDVHQAGAPGALGLVHDVHQAGAPGAHKLSNELSNETLQETIGGSAGNAKARRGGQSAKKSGWHFVPAAWEPKDHHRATASAQGRDFETELQRFRAHEFKDTKTDADRAFTRWLLNSFGRPSPSKAPRVQQGMAFSDDESRQSAARLAVGVD